MGIVLVLIGLFLWFTLAFNGGVGETFVNYSFFISALLMIVAGIMRIVITNDKLSRIICSGALLFYLPMVWQRFNFKSDGVGFYFDATFIVFMMFFIFIKSNKPIQDST